MTFVDLILASAQNGRLAVYALASPTTGDIVINWDGTINQGVAVAAGLFSNVVTNRPPVSSFTLNNVNSIQVIPTSLWTDLIVDFCSFSAQPGITVTPDAGQTLLAFQDNGGNDQDIAMSMKEGAWGSTTMTWLCTGVGEPLAQDAIALRGV
jgi:hypothetical protein